MHDLKLPIKFKKTFLASPSMNENILYFSLFLFLIIQVTFSIVTYFTLRHGQQYNNEPPRQSPEINQGSRSLQLYISVDQTVMDFVDCLDRLGRLEDLFKNGVHLSRSQPERAKRFKGNYSDLATGIEEGKDTAHQEDS
jgi:hypothetical protein